jgi:hypothetical protein
LYPNLHCTGSNRAAPQKQVAHQPVRDKLRGRVLNLYYHVRRIKGDQSGDKKGDTEEYRWLEVESSSNYKASWNMREDGSKASGKYEDVSGAVYD